jgi:hypothetical protein
MSQEDKLATLVPVPSPAKAEQILAKMLLGPTLLAAGMKLTRGEPGPVFYSRLLKFLNEKSRETMPAGKLREALAKAGISREEIRLSGLDVALGKPKEQVEVGKLLAKAQDELDKVWPEFDTAFERKEATLGRLGSENANKLRQKLDVALHAGDYEAMSRYEKLLGAYESRVRRNPGPPTVKYGPDQWPQYNLSGRASRYFEELYEPKWAESYSEPHFRAPAAAHTRGHERTVIAPGGEKLRSMHIDEVQSNLYQAQEAHRRLYDQFKKLDRDYEKGILTPEEFREEVLKLKGIDTPGVRGELLAGDLPWVKKPEQLPFEADWYKIPIRKVLRRAIEEDLDAVSVSTAEHMAHGRSRGQIIEGGKGRLERSTLSTSSEPEYKFYRSGKEHYSERYTGAEVAEHFGVDVSKAFPKPRGLMAEKLGYYQQQLKELEELRATKGSDYVADSTLDWYREAIKEVLDPFSAGGTIHLEKVPGIDIEVRSKIVDAPMHLREYGAPSGYEKAGPGVVPRFIGEELGQEVLEGTTKLESGDPTKVWLIRLPREIKEKFLREGFRISKLLDGETAVG